MISENKKIIKVWYIISLLSIFTGAIAGSLYYVREFFGSADIKNYLDGYANSLRNGMDFLGIVKKSLKDNMILFICITIASCLKHGIFLSAFFLVRKGFINAFTVSSMIGVYGYKGLAFAAGTFTEILIFIPLLLFFAAVSAFVSKKRGDFEKRDKIIYIIFLLVIFTIFCGCAFLEGVLTTTFMKWIAFKVT